ncbi:MAG: hypothetical protein JWP09_794 [Candidatus Taylorbacteria bacterium]|nr:hypothetical protein [Candidatus Taylorbacteria bacterium]
MEMKKIKSQKKSVKAKSDKFVVVTNKSYGNNLKGTKIYFEGKKPKGLKKDGTIVFGKHTLEALKRKLGTKFRLIITSNDDSIKLERAIYRVRISQKTFKSMGDKLRERTRDIKNDIVSSFFSLIYPEYFTVQETPMYIPGSLSHMIGSEILPRLSTEDREAMNRFLPDYIASESLNSINLLKATAQIKTLKELAADLEKALDASYSEGWWQTYIKKNILIIQQGYIAAIEKMNVTVGGIKFPDFSLVTHDGYLDILEIKKPNTTLLKHDGSRNNYFWDPEMAKAVIQSENYIENVSRSADAIRSYILDNHGIQLKVVRPRGIILAGDTRKFSATKESDDFRLLSLSTKNIVFVTYDELLSRLNNYIKVLEDHSK